MASEYLDDDRDDDQAQSDEEGWQSADEDMGNEEAPPQCLFCEHIFSSTKKVLDHCRQQHGFDLKTVREKLGTFISSVDYHM